MIEDILLERNKGYLVKDHLIPMKQDYLYHLIRYKRIGYRNGDNPNLDYQIWNDNHTATLEDYGLSQNDMYDLSTHVEED
jgi:hypothetical protein